MDRGLEPGHSEAAHIHQEVWVETYLAPDWGPMTQGQVPHREQHQELFIGGAVQKHSQTGATVERRGGDRHQSSILQQERKRKYILKSAGKTPALLVAWACSSPCKTVCPIDGQKRKLPTWAMVS